MERKYMSTNDLNQEKSDLGDGRYWKGTGKHQDIYNKLWVCVETDRGLLLKRFESVYYDYYNNGFCNIDQYLGQIYTLKELIIKFDISIPDKFFKKLYSIANAFNFAEDNYDDYSDKSIIDKKVEELFTTAKDFEIEMEIVFNTIIKYLNENKPKISAINIHSEINSLKKEINRLNRGLDSCDNAVFHDCGKCNEIITTGYICWYCGHDDSNLEEDHEWKNKKRFKT